MTTTDVALSTGESLSVQDEGRGSPVVLLHGLSMTSAFFRFQLGGGLAGFRLVAPDFRGHGASEKILEGHTVKTYAQDIHALVEELGLERPALVGWSMGAMVALDYLEMYGEDSASALVIVDQPPSDFKWRDYEFGIFDINDLAAANDSFQNDHLAEARSFAELMLKDPNEADVEFMATEIMRCPSAIASSILVDQTIRDYRDSYKSISIPTLVAFGLDDKLTNPLSGEWITSELRKGEYVSFQDSGHCPFYEEPERFNSVLYEFLNRK